MLTYEDIELLLETIDAWEKQKTSDGLMTATLEMMLTSSREESERQFTETMDEAKAETNRRKRRAILLKAKLVQMQDELTPDQLFSRVSIMEPGP